MYHAVDSMIIAKLFYVTSILFGRFAAESVFQMNHPQMQIHGFL